MLCTIANNAAVTSRVPTLFFSLESARTEIVKRIVCMRARVDLTTLRNGQESEQDLQKVLVQTGKVKGAPLFIVDTQGLTVSQCQSIARRHVSEHGVKLILGDYLQRVRPSERSEKRTYELAEVSGGLKAMAAELNVPAVWTAQLSREVEKTGTQGKDGKPPAPRPPRPSDLGDSGQIERDADLITLLHRLPDQASAGRVQFKLIIAKNRNGPCGSIPLTFEPQITRFTETSKVE